MSQKGTAFQEKISAGMGKFGGGAGIVIKIASQSKLRSASPLWIGENRRHNTPPSGNPFENQGGHSEVAGFFSASSRILEAATTSSGSRRARAGAGGTRGGRGRRGGEEGREGAGGTRLVHPAMKTGFNRASQ